MTKLEQYRALNSQYDTLVKELKGIQALEDAKKKEIYEILQQIKKVIE